MKLTIGAERLFENGDLLHGVVGNAQEGVRQRRWVECFLRYQFR